MALAPGRMIAAMLVLSPVPALWAQTAMPDHAVAEPTQPGEQKATPHRSPAPKNAYVYLGWPNDGEIIRSTRFRVWFGTRNFGVCPAGFDRPNTGHHHLLIDVPLPPLDQPIPHDKNHLHFGAGQTETVLELPPGKHTLQLLMGDADHVPHDPPVLSRRISVTVRAD